MQRAIVLMLVANRDGLGGLGLYPSLDEEEGGASDGPQDSADPGRCRALEYWRAAARVSRQAAALGYAVYAQPRI